MQPLATRILIAIVALCTDATLSRAEVVSIECQATNGTGFRVDIDTGSLSVIRHGYEDVIFKNGGKLENPQYPRDCSEYVRASKSSYSWGGSCPSSGGVVYSEEIDRYTGAYTGHDGMFAKGPGSCSQVPNGPRF
jgi:hypothetical protein